MSFFFREEGGRFFLSKMGIGGLNHFGQHAKYRCAVTKFSPTRSATVYYGMYGLYMYYTSTICLFEKLKFFSRLPILSSEIPKEC